MRRCLQRLPFRLWLQQRLHRPLPSLLWCVQPSFIFHVQVASSLGLMGLFQVMLVAMARKTSVVPAAALTMTVGGRALLAGAFWLRVCACGKQRS